jgi:hypothetical protein
MTDSELLALNETGFIPGPKETVEVFEKRVAKTRAALEPKMLPQAHWHWPKERLKNLFDFDPQSLPVFYSNENLTFWQGAACWIDDGDVPILQLRNGFKKGTYLKIYSREEVLAHEAVHAARAAFDEEENEEFFAYASTSVRWRSVLGPLLKRPWEAWVTLILFSATSFFLWSLPVSIAWVGTGFCRLCRQHHRLSQASLVLLGKLKDQKIVRAVLFRLTDREIRDLANGIWPQPDETLRWRLLELAYFKGTLSN